MTARFQFIVDENGQKTSVLVPLKVWEELNSNYDKLQAKLQVFNSIREGFAEVQEAKKAGKKLQTLKGFLK